MDWRKIGIAIIGVIVLMFILSGDLSPEGDGAALRPVQITWHEFLWNYPRLFTALLIFGVVILILKPGGGGGGGVKH